MNLCKVNELNTNTKVKTNCEGSQLTVKMLLKKKNKKIEKLEKP